MRENQRGGERERDSVAAWTPAALGGERDRVSERETEREREWDRVMMGACQVALSHNATLGRTTAPGVEGGLGCGRQVNLLRGRCV